MTASRPATGPSTQAGPAGAGEPLAGAIAHLEAALRTLDAQGLSVPALHVSMGLELTRQAGGVEADPVRAAAS